MSDFFLPDDDLDELASAFVDNEASPQESAAVREDERLLARVEQFAEVREELSRSRPSLGAGRRDELLSAALSAFDESRATTEAPSAPTGGPAPTAVYDLTSQASRRDRMAARLRAAPIPLLTAAAVIAVIAGLAVAGLLWGARGEPTTSQVASEIAPRTTSAAAADADGFADEMAVDAASGLEAEAYDYDLDDSVALESSPQTDEMASAPMSSEGAQQPSIELEFSDSEQDDAAVAFDDMNVGGDSGDDQQDPPDAQAMPGARSDAAIDLGRLADIEALWDRIDAFEEDASQAERDDAALVESGECASSLQDHAASLGGSVTHSFVAVIEEFAPQAVDAIAGAHPDTGDFAVYARGPECEPITRPARD